MAAVPRGRNCLLAAHRNGCPVEAHRFQNDMMLTLFSGIPSGVVIGRHSNPVGAV